MGSFNYNEIAQSLYSLMQNINTAVSESVGLDVLWFRAVPADKSEDVIFQEYTLLNVECGKELKAVANKTDYNPGALSIDLFGVSYPTDFEVSVDMNTWKSVYGDNSMPQKDDIVYVKMLHKLYEVKTSTVNYTIAEQPTSYNVVLCKYNPTVSRRESESLRQSIDDLTVSREELFGTAISDVVADITDPIEFDGFTTTHIDSLKEYEKESILQERVEVDTNIIAEAVYDMSKVSKPITYNVSMEYNNANYVYFSCWAKIKSGNSNKNEVFAVKSMEIGSKGKTETTVKICIPHKMESGKSVVLFRGSLLTIEGYVSKVEDKISGKYEVTIKNSEYYKANKKLSNWVETGGWKIKVPEVSEYNLLSSKNGNFDFNLKDNKLTLKIGSTYKEFELPEKVNLSNWNYYGIEVTPESTVNVYVRSTYTYRGMMKSKQVFSTQAQLRFKEFNSGDFYIDNVGAGIEMFNIRLYENETQLSETQVALDSQSRYVENASKLIFVDAPNVDNKMNYIGRIS